MGVISRAGDNGLIAMRDSGRSISEFVEQLNLLLRNSSITYIVRFFTSICLATGFLGVALSLSDFLADGFTLARNGINNTIITVITFLPPLVIALFYPGAFIGALSYAGIYCVILLIFLPALMAWRGRYHKKIADGYRVFGGETFTTRLNYYFCFSDHPKFDDHRRFLTLCVCHARKASMTYFSNTMLL